MCVYCSCINKQKDDREKRTRQRITRRDPLLVKTIHNLHLKTIHIGTGAISKILPRYFKTRGRRVYNINSLIRDNHSRGLTECTRSHLISCVDTKLISSIGSQRLNTYMSFGNDSKSTPSCPYTSNTLSRPMYEIIQHRKTIT